jgi:large subunit ribosomal protein L9
MEIILLEHIDDLGTVGQTLKVKDGYARNFLLPRKLACLATPQNQRYYRTLIEAKQKKLAKARGAAQTQADTLSGEIVTFFRKSRGEEGRLFGSVTAGDIAESLLEKGFEIEKKRVTLSEPIKKLGEYTASVKLHPEVIASLTVIVKSEEESGNAG